MIGLALRRRPIGFSWMRATPNQSRLEIARIERVSGSTP
jgi:hypothetical protein